MNEQLIEQITKMVVEKLQETKGKAETRKSDEAMPVNLFADAPVGQALATEHPDAGPAGAVTFHRTTEQKQPAATSKVASADVGACHKQDATKQSDAKETELAELRKKTPARVGVGRAGSRPKTKTWLQFRLDHAAAVDAVYGEVPDELLDRLELFQVHSKVADKEEYIRRPDLGRRLSDEAKQTVLEKCKKGPTVQIVASNGLSAKAIEENLEDVYLSLEQSLRNLNIDMGTTFYVDKGRVALMDEIGEMLQPDVVVMLIGERPGLVSAESLSAYLCYQPRIGTIEADRMVISNIHKGGIPPVEAGAYLGTVIQKVLKFEASGVSLVNKEG
ncbi:ethanolamine ammonia-lyase subunit EutC [Sporosarcina cyprini]|uniref:ethanolamine ammonia-lyase subunit EutC n=1 Tax=Sporosarcina cyprini TaxID=2910523 RepID=UPI001EE129A5|nr:ethanolamine ammonia-lyase subunit EutC [Sporosarcina cyprini]MCG3087166.1 ethanolamine ammonia-lyase subunit EutC [Sporosarcina cyprini]